MNPEKLKQMYIFLILILMLALTGCSASDSSDDDGGGAANGSVGSVSEPVVLSLSGATATSVGPSTGSYFCFATTEAGSYSVTVTNVTGASIGLSLKSDSGFTTDHTAGISGSGSCSSADTECIANLNNLDANSTYYLLITASESPGATYTLQLSDGVGQGSENNPEPLTLGTALNGELEEGKASYYALTATTAGGYEIQTSSMTGTNEIWVIEKSVYVAGQVLSDNDTPPYTYTGCHVVHNIDKLCIFALKSAIEYMVVLSGGGATPAREGAFTITASRGQGDGADGGPVTLPLDTVTAASLYKGGNGGYYKNYYTFTADAIFQDIDITSNTGNLKVQVLNSSGTEVATCTGTGNFSCNLSGLSATNTYTLVITNFTTTSTAGEYNAFSLKLY